MWHLSSGFLNLMSSDGRHFMVETSVAIGQSKTIKNMVEADGVRQGLIFVSGVSGAILSKVIDYCRRKHIESAASLLHQMQSKAWEYEFVRLDPGTLHHLQEAAYSLRIDGLFYLTFQAAAQAQHSSTMSTSSTRVVTLMSSDGECFAAEESVTVQSQAIMNAIGAYWPHPGKVIGCLSVSGKILSKVIEFCRMKHHESIAAAWQIDKKAIKACEWEHEFLQVDKSTLHDLDRAALHLGIKSLMDLTFKTLKDMSHCSPMSISSKGRMVTLKSLDGNIFMVEEPVAVVSQTIKKMIKYGGANTVIPIDYVSGRIFFKVIDYCRRKHLEYPAADETIPVVDKKESEAWEHEFVQVDYWTRRDLEKAANFLALDSLRDLILRTPKDMPAGRAVQETRKRTRTDHLLGLTLGRDSTEVEQSQLGKQYSSVNDRPGERGFSIPNEPPRETDLGKESTKADEKGKGKIVVD